MDNLIKKENVTPSDNDVQNLLEYSPSQKPKKQVVDKRSDGDFFGEILLEDDIISYNQYNSRDNYPWEEEYDFDLSENEIQQIKNQYENNEYQYVGETKIITPRRTAKYKGVEGKFVSSDQFGSESSMTNSSSTRSSNSRKKLTYKESNGYKPTGGTGKTYNGWPLIPPASRKDMIVGLKVPGIKSVFDVAKPTVPLFFNFIYDFSNTVEDINMLVPVKRGKNLQETRALGASGKVKMFQGDGGYAYRKVNNKGGGNSWSCHASATAIDINWNYHWLGWQNTFDKPGQIAQIYKLIKYYHLRWGGNFGAGYVDDMHFEIWVSPDKIESVIREKGLVERMEKIKSGIKPSSIP
jgi:hypothetical protein